MSNFKKEVKIVKNIVFVMQISLMMLALILFSNTQFSSFLKENLGLMRLDFSFINRIFVDFSVFSKFISEFVYFLITVLICVNVVFMVYMLYITIKKLSNVVKTYLHSERSKSCFSESKVSGFVGDIYLKNETILC